MPPLLPAALVTSALLAATIRPVVAGDGSWTWPVDGVGGGSPTVHAEFEAPASEYAPGHRGIDLPTLVGATVRAVAGGEVRFAGRVAGVGVITVDHGAERSTYQPVAPTVSVGDSVEAGDVIGRVVVGPFHCPSPCLHLGRIAQADDAYLDPLDRLPDHSKIRLVDPHGPPPVPPAGAAGAGVLRRPVAGPVTSSFGTRRHPATGEDSFHDGVDFADACGAPVRAAAAGTVVAVGRSGAYGLRVLVRHAGDLETSYGHLSAALVGIGDEVEPATVIGKVGSTGLSTGCHLHFGVRRGNQPLDPMGML